MSYAFNPEHQANEGRDLIFGEEIYYPFYPSIPLHDVPQAVNGPTSGLYDSRLGIPGDDPTYLEGNQSSSSAYAPTSNPESGHGLGFFQPAASSQPPFDSSPSDAIALADTLTTRRRHQTRSPLPSLSSSSMASLRFRSIRPYPPSNIAPRRSEFILSRDACDPESFAGLSSRHGQTLLLSLSSPVPPKALLPMQLAPMPALHTPPKLTPEVHQHLVEYFNSLPWLSPADPQEEPAIQSDDKLIARRFIEPGSKSRFYAFISAGYGDYVCRIPHTIKIGRQKIECNKRFKAEKDALAHVCDYLGYKAYKCKGKTEKGQLIHAACGKIFSTKERRNDHFSKANTPEEAIVPCSRCKIRIMRRNHSRHHERCSSVVPMPTGPIQTPDGRKYKPKCGCT